MSIDLHIHSVYSDGTHTPEELVRLAGKHRLEAIALTDHDTIAGIPECIGAGKAAGIEVVPGIELSVEFEGRSLHLLGYHFDYLDAAFNARIAVLQEGRKKRNTRIIEKLNELGIAVTREEVEAVSRAGQTGRPHIAQVLVDRGVVASIDEAFGNYLARGARAYASRFVYSVEEAIALLARAGGLSVLAHPVQADSFPGGLASLVARLAASGLDGIEVYYPSYSAATRRRLKAIAKKHGLVISGGSDYHGEIRPGSALAGGRHVSVPREVLAELRHRAGDGREGAKNS